MATIDRAKQKPETGHSEERLKSASHVKATPLEQAGTRICDRCGAVGIHKHWFADRKLKETLAARVIWKSNHHRANHMLSSNGRSVTLPRSTDVLDVSACICGHLFR